MAIDADWGSRMNLLVQLMQTNPNKRMKRLQREALKYYPLASKEAQRQWMSAHTALKAADRIIEKERLHESTPI